MPILSPRTLSSSPFHRRRAGGRQDRRVIFETPSHWVPRQTAHRSATVEPMVCRLSAGGRWIRTIGTAYETTLFATPFGPAIRLPLIQALVSTSASTAPNTAESLLRRLESHFQSPEKARESAYLRPAAGPGLLGMAEFRHRPAHARAKAQVFRAIPPARLVRQMLAARCEPDQESRMVLKSR